MSAAGDLINYLISIADGKLVDFDAAANTLRVSPNTGEIIKVQPFKPLVYVPPTLAFPTIPAAPANTVIDASSLNTAVADIINNINGSWMKQYFPTVSEMGQFDALETLLEGDVDLNDLNAIESDLRAALLSAITTMRTQLDSAISLSKSNLDAKIAGLQPKIDAALTRAGDDSAQIAWARARDQAAREAQRQEREAISDWASRGWPMPSGVLAAQAEVSRQATINASSAMAAEQAVQISKHYLDIAKMSIDNWLKAAELQVTAEITAYKTAEEHRLKTTEMEMEGFKERARTELAGLSLQVDLSKFAGDTEARYRLGIHQALNGLVNAYADAARTGFDSRGKIAESQRSVIGAMADFWRAALTSSDIIERGKLQSIEQEMKWSQEAANIVVKSASNFVQAATASADVYARVAAMALGGLNGVASIAATE